MFYNSRPFFQICVPKIITITWADTSYLTGAGVCAKNSASIFLVNRAVLLRNLSLTDTEILIPGVKGTALKICWQSDSLGQRDLRELSLGLYWFR